MALHKVAPVGEIHPIHNWSVADATARLALSISAADIGKVAAQISDATFWILQNNTGPVWKNITNGATGIPTGGTTGQSLRKINGTDYNVSWQDTLPAGGSTGQVLTKNSPTNQDASWITPSGGGSGSTGEAPFTIPPTTGWSWINQGTSTIASANNALTIVPQITASGANIRAYVRTLANASPYTCIARFKSLIPRKSFNSVGMCISNGTGIIVFDALGITNASTNSSLVRIAYFSNATTFGAAKTDIPVDNLDDWWFKIQDNTANRIFSISKNGYDWYQMFSEARTTNFTATQIGIAASGENSATPNQAPTGTLVSWLESNP